jgi:hypothetical protein
LYYGVCLKPASLILAPLYFNRNWNSSKTSLQTADSIAEYNLVGGLDHEYLYIWLVNSDG